MPKFKLSLDYKIDKKNILYSQIILRSNKNTLIGL